MKNLSFSKKRMKRAVQQATLAIAVGCTAKELVAAPASPAFTPTSGVWTVNGSTVTASGSSSSASFVGTTSGYNITVNSGASLANSGSSVVGAGASVIALPQGSVMNAGAISISNSAPGASSSGIYFANLPASGNGVVINSGTISAANTNPAGNTDSAYGIFFSHSNGNVNVVNSGQISATTAAGNYAIGVYVHRTTGSVASVTNTGMISASGSGADYGIILLNTPTSGTVYASVTNSGTISAYGFGSGGAAAVGLEDRDNTLGAGTAIATLVNNGTITAKYTGPTSFFTAAGVFCSRPQELTVTNGGQGVIQGLSVNGTGSGIYIIPGVTGSGTFLTNTATINNQGIIKGTSNNGPGYGIFDSSTNLLNVSSTGTILGTTDGILSTTGTTNLNLNGGTLAGTNGSSAKIVTGTINVLGRTQLVAGSGTDLVATGTTGNLNLKLVGGTRGQLALARAAATGTSGSFVFGGYTYSWNNFNVNLQATSLELACAPQYSDLASKIDSTALPVGYDAFYTAALTNPNAALNELSGFSVIQGTQDLEVNSQNTFLSTVENQLESLDGLGGFSTANLTIGTSALPGVNSADSQLTRLVAYADSKMNSNVSNSVTDPKDNNDPKEVAPTSPTPSGEKWTVWLAGGVTLAHEDAYTGAAGYNAVNGSPMLGFDYAVCPDFKVGFLAAATIDGANFGDGSRVDDNTELFGLYGSWHHGPWFANGLVAGGPSQYSDRRSTFGGTASANPDGYAVDVQTTVGYTYKINSNLSVTPEFGVQYAHLGVDSYSESGAGIFNTNVASQDIDTFRTHLGGKLDGTYDITSDFKLIPEFRAAWYHEYLTTTRGVGTSLAGAPGFGTFNVDTLEPDRDYALVGLGLDSIFTGIPNMPLGWFLNYDVQAGQSNYIQQNISGGMRVSF